ncbi:hypothetical protein R9C00_08780 [Flammeovirgaceae bacterium SG7u.111]|nr:hypothetical protein [Flammeovirgaceae bacterium SG7u.132]WPO37542.1 hypothetical protein R9C00_08780 [Flammeovirgaceae bacterium SG7u.111]
MRNLILIAILFVANYGYAQFGIESQGSPLYAIEQEFQKKGEVYLLDKDDYSSPDQYFQTLIDQPLNRFTNLELKSSLNHSSIYHATASEIETVYGSAVAAEPVLHFYEGRLSKVLLEASEAKGIVSEELFKSLKNKFGKPNYKDKFEIGASEVRVYRWEGYKVNVQLLVQEEEGVTRQAIVIEDKLMTKLEEADKQQKEFVQQEMLFSDVQSIFR